MNLQTPQTRHAIAASALLLMLASAPACAQSGPGATSPAPPKPQSGEQTSPTGRPHWAGPHGC
jgi:hypothetical protein